MQQLCHPKIRCKSDMIPYYLVSTCKNFIDKRKKLKLKQKECNPSTGEEYKRQCQKITKERIHTHTHTQKP